LRGTEARRHLAQHKTSWRHVDDGNVRVDALHYAGARERVAAVLQQLVLSVPGDMVGDHQHAAQASDQVHGATARRYGVVAASGPVGEISIGGNLERPEDTDINVAAA